MLNTKMKRPQLTKYEQETIINYNAEGKTAELYTCELSVMRKLDKLCERDPDNYKLKEVDKDRQGLWSKTYIFPKNLISFRVPRAKKEYTDEERKIISDRMKALRQQQLDETA